MLIYVQFVDVPELQSGMLDYKDSFRKNGTVELLYKSITENDGELCSCFFTDLCVQYKAEHRLSESKYSEDVSAFIDYVKSNYREKISVKSFADSIFMTHTGFLMKFKRETGVTPVEYIGTFRLGTASQLLFDSNLTVSSIAEMCGYENLYYFNNAFKKKFGLSPMRYGKNNV